MHFTDKVIPAKYRAVRANIEKQLATIEKCTMTTDLWTAQHQQHSYNSLTVHFIDNDFELQSRCLQTLEVPQDHNASSIWKCWTPCSRTGKSQKKCVEVLQRMEATLSMPLVWWKSNTFHVFHTLCSCPLKWPQCSKGTVSSRSVLEAGWTFQKVYQRDLQATKKARDAETASAQAYPELYYPLGQHIRHANKTDGVTGSHCSRLDGREGEVFDARGRGVGCDWAACRHIEVFSAGYWSNGRS